MGRLKEGAEHKDRCYTRVYVDGKWKLKHRYLWEQNRGTIPPGHCICFLDGNQKNLSLDNMACVPRATLMSVVKSLGNDRHPEVTRTHILLCELRWAVKGVCV